MTAQLLSYARISSRGLLQRWAEGPSGKERRVSWAELGAGAPDCGGLPPLKGRYFSGEPSPRFGRMDALCKLALGAAELCMAHAPELTRQDVAIVGGSMLGCLEVDAQYHDTLLKGGPAGASPALFVYTLPSMFLGEIAIRFGLRGRTAFISTGNTTAAAALANGVRLIEKGRAPAVLVIAAEAVGEAAQALDLREKVASGACAWLLALNGDSIASLANVHFGEAQGEPLETVGLGGALACVDHLEFALGHHDETYRCGEGANAITLDIAVRPELH